MLAHEVRTPLNIVSFSTSLLRRDSCQCTKEQRQPYLEHIQTAVEQLSELLDEVLIIGKVEAGILKFSPKPLDLTAFCCDLVAQMQLMSNSSQHAIAFVSRGNCSTARVDKKLPKVHKLILLTLIKNIEGNLTSLTS